MASAPGSCWPAPAADGQPQRPRGARAAARHTDGRGLGINYLYVGFPVIVIHFTHPVPPEPAHSY